MPFTELSNRVIERRTNKCLQLGKAGYLVPFGKLPGGCKDSIPKRRKGRYSRCYSARIFFQRPNRPGVLLIPDSKGRLRSCGKRIMN